MVRVRFTSRALLGATAVAALAIYLCVVRPTAEANRLAESVERGDFELLSVVFGVNDLRLSEDGRISDTSGAIDRVFVEVMPPDWRDWLRCRRRIRVSTARHWSEDGRYIDWVENDEFVAGLFGLKRVAANGAGGG